MNNITITKFQPRKGLTLTAIELTSTKENISPCCTKYTRKLYCNNRIIEEVWYHRVDASTDADYDREVKILEYSKEIPELNKILNLMYNIDMENITF